MLNNNLISIFKSKYSSQKDMEYLKTVSKLCNDITYMATMCSLGFIKTRSYISDEQIRVNVDGIIITKCLLTQEVTLVVDEDFHNCLVDEEFNGSVKSKLIRDLENLLEVVKC